MEARKHTALLDVLLLRCFLFCPVFHTTIHQVCSNFQRTLLHQRIFQPIEADYMKIFHAHCLPDYSSERVRLSNNKVTGWYGQTHQGLFLEVLLAAYKVSDMFGDVLRPCATIPFYPLPHFVMGALVAEISRRSNGETLHWVFHNVQR